MGLGRVDTGGVKTVGRAEVRAALAGGHVIVVDALPVAPYRDRHLPGAVNLTVEQLPHGAAALFPGLDRPIIAYSTDANCDRAPRLAEALTELEYADVAVYTGGIAEWVAADLPVNTGDEP